MFSPYSFVLLMLVHLHTSVTLFLKRCPEKMTWNLRANDLCGVKDKYMCLYDVNEQHFRELCKEKPEFHRPGNYFVISGNLNYFAAKTCKNNKYQPHKWWTNGSSECNYFKTACNGEGQIPHDNGDITRNRRCRCDYTNYYTFVNSTVNKCYCDPIEEDCSCYRKRCSEGQVLTPDYVCIYTQDWTGQFVCPDYKQPKFIDEKKRSKQTTLLTGKKRDSSRTDQQTSGSLFVTVLSGTLIITGSLVVLYEVKRESGKKKREDLEDIINTLIHTHHKLLTIKTEEAVDYSEIEQTILKIPSEKDEISTLNIKENDENKVRLHVYQDVGNVQEEYIPKNIREINRVLCDAWMEEDKTFVATRASDYTIKCLQTTNCVTLTGPAGVGKSFVARHVALNYRKGYEIIPVYSPTDMRDYYQHGKHTVFIIDDMFGKLVISQQQIEQWAKLLPVINTILKDNCCKIIVACRLDIFNDVRFNMLSPFKSCECNFISNDLCLIDSDKENLALTYIGKDVYEIDDIPYDSFCFPLLCSLHHEHNIVCDKGSYKNKIDFYKTELDNLRMQGDDGKYKICSLAVCVLLNTKLKDTWFLGEMLGEQKRFIEDMFNAFRLQIITKLQLQEKIDTLVGIFISTNNGSYKIIDDKLLEFLTLYFGQLIPECFIQHGDSKLIHTHFIRKTSMKKTTCNKDIIQIPDEYLELYIKRLIDDWSTGNIAIVFGNTNMKEPSFRNQVVQTLQRLDISQQHTLSNTRNAPLPENENDVVTSPLLETCFFNFPEILRWLLDNDVDVNQIINKGISGLLKACQKGHTTIVTMLLEKNCNVNLSDSLGHSPLYFASRNGHTDVVKLLLMNNPNVDICDNNGCSPLYMASQKGHTEVVNMLLLKNPNVDLCDNNGCSPLYMAIQNEHMNVVKLLLDRNPDVDICDTNGCSPLNMASQKGHTEVVNMLLLKNSNVDLCDNNGCSPLIMAIKNEHINVVKLLLEKNPNVNLCDNIGCCPLYMACQHNRADMVKLLLDNNADVNICDKDGHTPMFIASQNGSTDIVKLFTEYELPV